MVVVDEGQLSTYASQHFMCVAWHHMHLDRKVRHIGPNLRYLQGRICFCTTSSIPCYVPCEVLFYRPSDGTRILKRILILTVTRHRSLGARCVTSRLFSTTGSHGSQGPELCTLDHACFCRWVVFRGVPGVNNVIIGTVRGLCACCARTPPMGMSLTPMTVLTLRGQVD